MSVLSAFIQKELLNALEKEFMAHNEDMQTFFIKEIEAFTLEVLSWVKKKAEIHYNKPE
jgi:hypothetical protein